MHSLSKSRFVAVHTDVPSLVELAHIWHTRNAFRLRSYWGLCSLHRGRRNTPSAYLPHCNTAHSQGAESWDPVCTGEQGQFEQASGRSTAGHTSIRTTQRA